MMRQAESFKARQSVCMYVRECGAFLPDGRALLNWQGVGVVPRHPTDTT